MSRTWIRRPLTIGGVALLGVVLLVSAPMWIVLLLIVDLVLGRWRLPTLRLCAFGLVWAWLEVAGLVGALGTWMIGRARRASSQYALQRWWAAAIIRSLRVVCGLRIDVEGADRVAPGPAVCLVRHASYGDALVSAWVLGSLSRRYPRYVMKKELLLDPCLDVVGQRIPNWFVDRGSAAVRQEMAGIRSMAVGMGERDVAVIFPEGTRASDGKRAALLERLERRSPERHARLSELQHLLPPRATGAGVLLDAVPSASVVLMWHTGFDGLDSLRGIHRAIRRGMTRAKVTMESLDRREVPGGDEFGRWLDDRWIEMDRMVAASSN
ncbi:MAG: 1-acyl-sn-glycerol-3-phosphate acyltransferase [Acidimicrobiia bacterium]